jgi:hypothetical protein
MFARFLNQEQLFIFLSTNRSPLTYVNETLFLYRRHALVAAFPRKQYCEEPYALG